MFPRRFVPFGIGRFVEFLTFAGDNTPVYTALLCAFRKNTEKS